MSDRQVNGWINFGIALCLFAIILNGLYFLSWSLLLWALAIPGLACWWMLCLAFAWWVESRTVGWLLDDD
jgi:hypothetical protein